MRRTWIKLYCENWLRGSLRKERPEIRGIWADLLAMAGDNSFGNDGVIELAKGLGFTDETLAGVLNVPAKLWLTTKERLVNHPEPGENRIEIYTLPPGFGIRILNWPKYQSEYSRQKRYRRLGAPPLTLSPSSRKDLDIDIDREGAVTSVTTEVISKVTNNVTSALLPLPKNMDFKVRNKLVALRANIRRKERILNNPEARQTLNFNEKKLRDDLQNMAEEFNQVVKDYSE